MCALCNEIKNRYAVDYKGKTIMACSDCITDKLLTGWSK